MARNNGTYYYIGAAATPDDTLSASSSPVYGMYFQTNVFKLLHAFQMCMYAGLLAENSSMLQPPVECSTSCQDGFDGHVDSSLLLSPCAPPFISDCSGTPDVAIVSGMWTV